MKFRCLKRRMNYLRALAGLFNFRDEPFVARLPGRGGCQEAFLNVRRVSGTCSNVVHFSPAGKIPEKRPSTH